MKRNTRKRLIEAVIVVVVAVAVFSALRHRHIWSEINPIGRMGSQDYELFDSDWMFTRYGLQAEGNSIAEPAGLQEPALDDSGWRKLDLPHDWAIEGPFRIELEGSTGKLPYKGIGWYRKHFVVPAEDAGKQIFLDFDGAMANAQVWVNGKYAGTWPYGYSSFRMDITPYLNFGGGNIVAVRLDTEKWDSRWYSGAGIYRHVWLVKTGQVHVAHWGVFITTPSITDNSAVIRVDITLGNQGDKPAVATLRTRLYELDSCNMPVFEAASFKKTRVSIEPDSNTRHVSEVTLKNPRRWDIESPNRYLAETTVTVGGKVMDVYNTPFGVRTLEFKTEGFFLNGRKVPVQGTCNHHDLGALGAEINTSALKRQLTILKEMGCNSLRTSHNPPAPELLELADYMGFLVWDEAFDTWKMGKKEYDYNKLYDEWHEKDLRALVRRDRNHPSVFIWSIGNEVVDQRNVEMTKHLAGIVKDEDPTRPVSNGYNDPDGSRAAGSPQSLDIMGVNYFFGQQAKWNADPRYANMPTLGSETSSCVSSRGEYFFGTNLQNWQISSYDLAHPDWGCTPDEQFRTNAKFPRLFGEYVWTGFDYLGEPTPYNSDETNLLNFWNDPEKQEELGKILSELRLTNAPSRSSYFGIIDLCGFPKDRFYLYQSQWRPALKMAHILPHWNWEEKKGEFIPVHVYTSGNEGELFVNGVSMGRRKMEPGKDFRLLWDSVKYEPGTVKVVTYRDGEEWAENEIRTAGKAQKLHLSADRNIISADGSDLSFVTVRVQDNAGLTVPRTKPLLKFDVSGPGEIVASDNGDAISFVPFTSHEREAFNGMALVIVKAKKGESGSFTVSASAEGLTEGDIQIDIKK